METVRQAFVLRHGTRLKTALREQVIGFGWSGATDLLDCTDWEALKNSLRRECQGEGGINERALGNAAGSVWRFMRDMRPGDLVVVPVEGGLFHVAKATSTPYYEQSGYNEDFAWRRRAEWLTPSPVLRSFASNELRMRMKAYQTCVNATDLIGDIEAALIRKKPIDFNEEVLKAASACVAVCLKSAVDNSGLEQVVQKLATASGARAVVLPKNSGQPGDVDVMATYDLRIGNQESSINVAYQVKQHEGVTDQEGLKQLLERIEHDPSIVRACFVTTAKDVTPAARALAEESNIIVLAEKELVEWVLMVGLSAIS